MQGAQLIISFLCKQVIRVQILHSWKELLVTCNEHVSSCAQLHNVFQSDTKAHFLKIKHSLN